MTDCAPKPIRQRQDFYVKWVIFVIETFSWNNSDRDVWVEISNATNQGYRKVEITGIRHHVNPKLAHFIPQVSVKRHLRSKHNTILRLVWMVPPTSARSTDGSGQRACRPRGPGARGIAPVEPVVAVGT